MRTAAIAGILVALIFTGAANGQVVKSGTEAVDLDRAVLNSAVSTVPSSRQIAWHQREVQALVHFGMNTVTGKEWGAGAESPSLFNPERLDCGQWVQAATAFGAKSITLTCKHHDGFCLWPSQYTEHSVKRSPWKSGQGDVVRELSDACRKAGLKFGVYISPADLNQPTFGHNSAAYNDYFCAQLQELLTNYGEICEVFLDGAQPSRRYQSYDFPRYYRMIRALQPNAVITMRGPDVRWVGNEMGMGRETEWNVVPVPLPLEVYDWPDRTDPDLGSRSRLKGATALQWQPAVAAVSLRQDWFWHPGKDKTVKSLTELIRIHDQSVGRNAVLQLSLAPNAEGLIPDADFRRLQEFGAALQDLYAKNLLADSTDAQPQSMVAGNDGIYTSRISFGSQKVRRLVLQEDLRQGQRVETFELEVSTSGGEQKLFRATTIGSKRIFNLKDLAVSECTLRITQTRARPFVTVSAY